MGDETKKVYPRVGGETGQLDQHCHLPQGLSPRGRGNLFFFRIAPTFFRSIPAWAGKPCGCLRTHRTLRVYPRVGGETTNG